MLDFIYLRRVAVAALGGLLLACGGDDVSGETDAGALDSGAEDGGALDAGTSDAGASDAGPVDASMSPECEENADCDDGNPCSGAETCAEGACVPGTALDDGTACDLDGDDTTRDLCVASACVAARCGDGFVDETTSEESDDGNDVDGDGCDDCRFSCDESSDCDDGEDCNGAETCSEAHVCVAGTPLDEGAECAGGTGTCESGACLANSCTENGDCDDANVCNGAETCSEGACARGATLDCDDEDACTADSCDPVSGCRNQLIDADFDGHAPTSAGECGTDCDDTRADVYEGATDVCDGVDNDCDGSVDEGGLATWYADCDGDGYAATGARTVSSCARPAPGTSMCATGGGWTTRSPATAADCNDANAAVNPGQTAYQTTPIAGAPEASDFDYDCSAAEEARSTGRGSCRRAGLGCALVEGWEAATAPACGATADWVARCMSALVGCNAVTEERQQACR